MTFTFFREDIFILQDKDYIGALRSVSIKRDTRGQYSGWHLETVNDWVMLKLLESWYQYQLL